MTTDEQLQRLKFELDESARNLSKALHQSAASSRSWSYADEDQSHEAVSLAEKAARRIRELENELAKVSNENRVYRENGSHGCTSSTCLSRY